MKGRFIMLALFSVLFLAQVSYAAVIHGTIYDLSLEKAENALVGVDSQPQQRYLSVDGTYSFSLPKGNYILTAKATAGNRTTASAAENIEVSADGDYVLDLFLYPVFEEDEMLDTNEILLPERETDISHFIFYALLSLLVVLLLIIILIIIKVRKGILSRKMEAVIPQDENMEMLKSLLRKNRRMTQKELRKEMPVSEAKVSLMLAELEQKGMIQKIRKGRSNIVLWNQK